jgi:hypothetical protein
MVVTPLPDGSLEELPIEFADRDLDYSTWLNQHGHRSASTRSLLSPPWLFRLRALRSGIHDCEADSLRRIRGRFRRGLTPGCALGCQRTMVPYRCWHPAPDDPDPMAAILAAGGPLAISSDGRLLFSQAAPHLILAFDRRTRRETILARERNLLQPIAGNFVRRVDNRQTYDWWFPQSKGLLALPDGSSASSDSATKGTRSGSCTRAMERVWRRSESSARTPPGASPAMG